MKEKIKIAHKSFIRSLTNNGDKCKQYFFVTSLLGFDDTLIIRKLVLSKDIEMCYDSGFKLLKRFKNYYLVEQRFSIKVSTLKLALDLK